MTLQNPERVCMPPPLNIFTDFFHFIANITGENLNEQNIFMQNCLIFHLPKATDPSKEKLKLTDMRLLNCFIIMVLLIATACTSSKKSSGPSPLLDDNTYRLTEISTDESYGYSEKNPINVGGIGNEGAKNQRRFLNALLGPNGQEVTYSRQGSCCSFATKNGFSGMGLLDRYEVTYEGLEKPVILFLNFYDKGELRAPKGFLFKK
jgi:hypothetical protein